jgi:hypothetical protein
MPTTYHTTLGFVSPSIFLSVQRLCASLGKKDNSFKPLRPNPTSHNPRRSRPKLSNNGIKSQHRVLARLGFFSFIPQIKDFGAGAYLTSIAGSAVIIATHSALTAPRTALGQRGLREEDLRVAAVIGSAVMVDAPDSGKKPPGQSPLAHRLCADTAREVLRTLRAPLQGCSTATHSISGERVRR